MKNDMQTAVAAAMNALMKGYREEVHLYMDVCRLTWKQRDTFREGWDQAQFHDLQDEKENLLRMLGQFESEMRAAKVIVLSKEPLECPDRWQLKMLLDRLTETIEEIGIVESANASFLCTIPMAG
jgi:hypothetical protein